MKSRFVALLALTLCFSGRASAAAPFTDKNLEAAVRAELHDTKTTPLTETDLNNVYFLETPGKDIAFAGDNDTYSNVFRMPDGRLFNFFRGVSHDPILGRPKVGIPVFISN